jgi:hypothetical protein
LCILTRPFPIFLQGSGSNVDLCVITKDDVDYLRGYNVANKRGERFNDFSFARGTTGEPVSAFA